MPRLGYQATARLLGAVEVLHADLSPDSLFARMSHAALLAIRAETACFDGYNPAGGIGHLGSYPEETFSPATFPILAAALPEHPLFTALFIQRYPEPLRISDYCSMAQFYRTSLFNEYYRPIAITHQLIMTLETPANGLVTCALNRRRRDFTAEDRLVMSLLRTHFLTAIRNAHTVAQLQRPSGPHTTAPAPVGLVRIHPSGVIFFCDALAEQMLRTHFDAFASALLPGPLLWWLHQWRNSAMLAAPAEFVHRTQHTELTVRLAPMNSSELLLIVEERVVPTAAGLQHLGLTPRESEVLFYLTQGLPDKAISQSCGISLRTVQNHLQNIYSKLGVDNRTAAARYALA